MNTNSQEDVCIRAGVEGLCRRSHALAEAKGWHDPAAQPPDDVLVATARIMAAHAALSHTLEDIRRGGAPKVSPSDLASAVRTSPAILGSLEQAGTERLTLISQLALIATEITEAFEALLVDDAREIHIEDGKPEGVAVELADAMIRIAHVAGAFCLPLAEAIEVKHAYNTTRSFRHGGRRL